MAKLAAAADKNDYDSEAVEAAGGGRWVGSRGTKKGAEVALSLSLRSCVYVLLFLLRALANTT